MKNEDSDSYNNLQKEEEAANKNPDPSAKFKVWKSLRLVLRSIFQRSLAEGVAREIAF